MGYLSTLLVFTLVLHAYHARCHLYHHWLLSWMVICACPYSSEFLDVLRKSLSYFIAVAVLGDVQRIIHSGETWVLCFPTASIAFFLLGWAWPARRDRLQFLACLAGVAGLHCLFRVLY